MWASVLILDSIFGCQMKSKDEGQVNRMYKAQEMAKDTNYKNVQIKSVLQAYQRTEDWRFWNMVYNRHSLMQVYILCQHFGSVPKILMHKKSVFPKQFV